MALAPPPGTHLKENGNVDLPEGYTSRLILETIVEKGTFPAESAETFINNYLAARPGKQVYVRYFCTLLEDWRTYGIASSARPMRLGESISTYEGEEIDFHGSDVRALDFLVGDLAPELGHGHRVVGRHA